MLGHRTLNLEDYLGMVKRRGWIILIPLLILPILTYAYSYTISPQYLSKTLVLIESQKVPDNLVKPVISSDLDSRLASMQEQILSRSSLQPIIDRYNLYGDRKMTMDDRIDLARKNVDIKPIASEVAHSGGLPGFFISFKAGEARTAQLVCTDITSLFIAENLRSRSDSAEGTVSFLRSQLADAKRTLDEQDSKLADFQRQYFGRLPGEENTNGSMLASLNTQFEADTQALARMQQDKAYAETLLAQQLAAQQPVPVNTASGPVTAGPAISPQQIELQGLLAQRTELLTHYTADYPDVLALDRRIADVRRQIPRTPAAASSGGGPTLSTPSRFDSPAVQQLRAQIHSADIGIEEKRRELAQVQGNVHTYQDRIESSPLVEQQYKQLTRDSQTAQAFYDDLLAKMNTSKMATDLEKRQQGEQFRVQDAANLPEAPFSPKRSVFLMGGVAGGLMLGLAIVAFLEYQDTAMRSERDVWAFTKLPTLAIISYSADLPQLKRRSALLRFFFRRKPTPALQPAVQAAD